MNGIYLTLNGCHVTQTGCQVNKQANAYEHVVHDFNGSPNPVATQPTGWIQGNTRKYCINTMSSNRDNHT